MILMIISTREDKEIIPDHSNVGHDLPIDIDTIDIWEKVPIVTEKYGGDILRIEVYADTTFYQLKYFIKNQNQMAIVTFKNTRGEWFERPSILTSDVFPGDFLKKEEIKKNIKEVYEISLNDGGRDFLISKINSDVYTFITRTISLYKLDGKIIWDIYYDFAKDGSSFRTRKEI